MPAPIRLRATLSSSRPRVGHGVRRLGEGARLGRRHARAGRQSGAGFRGEDRDGAQGDDLAQGAARPGRPPRLLGDLLRAVQEVVPEAGGAEPKVREEAACASSASARTRTTTRTRSPASPTPTARSSRSRGTGTRRSPGSTSPRRCRRRSSSTRMASFASRTSGSTTARSARSKARFAASSGTDLHLPGPQGPRESMLEDLSVTSETVTNLPG